MKTRLYLVRHGESLGNKDQIFLGHIDRDLTPLGYRQAELLKGFFENIELSGVYSSDRKRAYNTALATARYKGLEIIPKKELREIFAGKWEGKTYTQISEMYPDTWRDWRAANVPDLRPDDGESLCEMFERIKNCLTEIAKENIGKNILIALHATPIRVMQNYLLKRKLNELYKTDWVSNASVTSICYQDGEFELEFADSREHLGCSVSILPPNV